MTRRADRSPFSRSSPVACAVAGIALALSGCVANPAADQNAVPSRMQQQWQAATGQSDSNDAVERREQRADSLYERGAFGQVFEAYLELARTGDKFSQYRIAFMYEHGQGVETDLAEAFAWASLAAELDDPRLDAYARHVTDRLLEAGPEVQTRAAQRGEALFERYSTTALIDRQRQRLERQLRTCTGSRIGACYGSASVATIDSGRDAAAWAAFTSGGGNALGRLRTQDGMQLWDGAREELRFLNRWFRDLTQPRGEIEYGPLILRDLEPGESETGRSDDQQAEGER